MRMSPRGKAKARIQIRVNVWLARPRGRWQPSALRNRESAMKASWLRSGICTFAFAALAACSSHQGNTTSSGETNAAAMYAPGGASQANPDWQPFVDSFIQGWVKLNPSFAVYEGEHEF